jgi:hypothetical protein
MSGRPPAVMASAPHPTAAPMGYAPQVGPVSMSVPMGYGNQTGFLPSQSSQGVPVYVPTAAPAFTPSGVSWAAIPSYGGVSVNVPGAIGTPGLGALSNLRSSLLWCLFRRGVLRLGRRLLKGPTEDRWRRRSVLLRRELTLSEDKEEVTGCLLLRVTRPHVIR